MTGSRFHGPPTISASTLARMKAGLLSRPIGSQGRNDVFWLGDSLTSDGAVSTVASGDRMRGAINFGPLSWPGWCMLQTGAQYVFGGIGATFGFTTDQIIATWLPSVVAAAPAVCFVLAGSNDVPANDLARTVANLKTIYSTLEAAGTLVIPCTIPPQGAAPVTFVTKLNTWIERYARGKGRNAADFHVILTDNAGGFDATKTRDGGTHPNDLGASQMGAVAAAALLALPRNPPPPLLLGGNDTNAMLTDVTFSAGMTWGLGGTGTLSSATDPTLWKGVKAQIIAGGASHNKQALGTVAVQPVAGDRISMAALLDAPVVPAGGTWSAGLYDTTGRIVTGWSGMTRTIPVGSAMAWQFRVDAEDLAAPLRVSYAVNLIDTTRLDFAQTSLLNLTSLGVFDLL